jgi:hypothetical protein
MPSHDDIMPRQVEREWFGVYAMIAIIGNAIVAMYLGWWWILLLTPLLIWQVVRAVQVMKKYE